MIEMQLEKIAEKILTFSEEDLLNLLPKYKNIIDNFSPTKQWEQAMVIYFLINAVRVTNTQFNENVKKLNIKPSKKTKLKLIK